MATPKTRTTGAKAPTTRKTNAKRRPADATPLPDHPGVEWRATVERKGMTQRHTAAAMGVSGMTLNRLFNGQGIPTARVTIAFAKATGQNPKRVWAKVCDYELALAMAAASGDD